MHLIFFFWRVFYKGENFRNFVYFAAHQAPFGLNNNYSMTNGNTQVKTR